MELPGERPFVLNHGIDVTEQHEAEEALHLATRQRELILESVGDGIYGIDLDGRLTFINQAAARASATPRRVDRPRRARSHLPQPRRRHALFQIAPAPFCRPCTAASHPHARRGFLAPGRHGDSGRLQRQPAA
jgi:PAS domain-containing protein